MTQRVFREWLQDQVRHERLRRARIYFELDAQSIGKPHLLNTQIQLDEVDLFSELDFMSRRILECVTQEIAQPDQHTHRRVVLVVANEADDVVQRVEKKMRVQLHA